MNHQSYQLPLQCLQSMMQFAEVFPAKRLVPTASAQLSWAISKQVCVGYI